MNVLITGATGFIGANLVRTTLAKRWNTYAIIRPNSINMWRLRGVENLKIIDKRSFMKGNLKTINGNILPQFDVCFHLAASGVSSPNKNYLELIEGNIIYTLKILEFCLANRTKKIIHIGSCFEYSQVEKFVKIHETHPLKPFSMYGATKASASIIASTFSKITGLPIMLLRLFGVFGKYESRNRLVPQVIHSLETKQVLELTPGNQVRDFLYVQDVVDAMLLVAENGPSTFEEYNLCSSNGITVKEFVQTICRVAKGNFNLMNFGSLDYRPGEPMWIVGDNSKFCSDFGWKPKYTIEEGIAETIKWYKNKNNMG